MNIGVFDSGLGGLTILKGILDVLPQYNYVYIGDNARVPYGGRSPETIYKFTLEAVEDLFTRDCQLVVIACNTASAVALRRLQKEWLPKNYPDRKVLGVLVPVVEAVSESVGKRIGLIGTYATVESDYFETELGRLNPSKDFKVFKKACPLLVPIIEEGETEWEGLESILRKYLCPLKSKNIDTLVLGCTHYGLIKPQIKEVVGPEVSVIAEEEITGQKLRDYLTRHKTVEKLLLKDSKLDIFVTDYSNRYVQMARMFFGAAIRLEEISL